MKLGKQGDALVSRGGKAVLTEDGIFVGSGNTRSPAKKTGVVKQNGKRVRRSV